MGNSSSTPSDLAKGKNFLEKLLYVQLVDKDKNTVSEISNRYLEEMLLADRTNFTDCSLTEYINSLNQNLSFFTSLLEDEITEVTVYSNPLPIPLQLHGVTFHAFVVFKTWNYSFHNSYMWWSLEKNGTYIVLQQSGNKDDVINHQYDTEQYKSVERIGPVEKLVTEMGWIIAHLENVLRIIWETNQISDPYNLLTSNCQHFASFIFEQLTGEMWTTAIVDRIGKKNQKIQPRIQVDAFKYKSIINDKKFDLYRAMMEGRRKDFEQLTNDLTIETLNGVDSQGYTLLEWATVFSTPDWPIDEELKKKGAEPIADEGSFRRNIFYIALQYLLQNQKFLSCDGIDITSVNETGDTALHLALYGEKWEIAEEILNRFVNYDVNITNSFGDTPLLLAARFQCEFGLFKKILNRTNSENVNKVDGNENTALHYAMYKKTKFKVKELLKREEVDVNITNKGNSTALHLASNWPNIPLDLFKKILERSADINAQNKNGNTALHYAILSESEIAVKKLLKHSDVNVDIKNKDHAKAVTALHLASERNFPSDLFNSILQKSTDINAQNKNGDTALHCAIIHNKESETKVKKLITRTDVDVNIKNNYNETALHLASSKRKNFPSDLFKIILEKSNDTNAQDKDGRTALHLAIWKECKIATKALLAQNDVDVNFKDENNWTPLHLASKWKDIPGDLFNLILEKSTNINAQDEEGDTALHYAISRECKIATKELLKHKDVNVDIKNNKNRTALHLASSKRKNFPSDLFKIILEKSNDTNAQDEEGDTALHRAIISKSEIATKALIGHNDVNVNIKNNGHATALDLVCKRTDAYLFKLISEKYINQRGLKN